MINYNNVYYLQSENLTVQEHIDRERLGVFSLLRDPLRSSQYPDTGSLINT